jgi:hypothetical protein
MTTSGTYNQSWPIDDLITEAWERCGKNPAIIDSHLAAAAMRSLRLMLIDWTNHEVPLWQIETLTVQLTGGESQVVLPDYVMDILDVNVMQYDGIQRVVARISRTDFVDISNKTVTGLPNQVWTDRQRDAVVLNLYPTPDQDYLMTYYALRQPQDLSALSQTADAPLIWAEALASSLAVRLAQKFAPERLPILQPAAEAAYSAASGENRERVPLTIAVSWDMWR